MGEQVAKAGGKVFAFFGGEAGRLVTVKLDESHGHALSIDGARADRLRARPRTAG